MLAHGCSGKSAFSALAWVGAQDGEVREFDDGFVFTKVLAARQVFLASRKTTLHLRLKIHKGEKELVVCLSLMEKSVGLALGTGAGSSSEVFKVGRRRAGKVQEDLKFLFERHRLSFDYTAFHREIEGLAQAHNYRIRWEILPV